MHERLYGVAISLIPGQIAVYPLSTRFDDMFTAEAIQCESTGMPKISPDEPFQAEFLDFDRSIITVRTERYRCLKVNLSDLVDLVPFNKTKQSNEIILEWLAFATSIRA